MKKSVFLYIIVICLSFLSCISVTKSARDKYYTVNMIDDNVYLDGDCFIDGIKFGEIPMEIHWSLSSESKEILKISGNVWTYRTQEYIPYSTFFLVKYINDKYDIVDTIHISDSTGMFLFYIEKQKLYSNYLAVYAPGCRSVVCQIIK